MAALVPAFAAPARTVPAHAHPSWPVVPSPGRLALSPRTPSRSRQSLVWVAAGLAAVRCRDVPGRARRQSRVGLRAASASAGPTASAAELLAGLPPGAAAAAAGGAALLLVPRDRAAELPALASAVESSLGAGVPVLAALSNASAPHLALTGPGAQAFALRAASLAQDLPALLAGAANAATVLVLADMRTPPPAVKKVLSELERACPSVSAVGAFAATPGDKGMPGIGGMGGAVSQGSLLALTLPAPTAAAFDMCGKAPFGPEMEVFEASLPRQGPATVLKIGTDQEGSVEDAEETEKGTAGIARRVSVPAAAAFQQAMKAAGIRSPKEVWVGVPGTPKSPGTPRVQHPGGGGRSTWALFPWVNMTKQGGAVLGGLGPVAEGLCPKASLEFVQCFRTTSPGPAGSCAQLLASRPGGTCLVIAGGAVPPNILKELAAGPNVVPLAGSVLVSGAGTGPAGAHTEALALLALGG